MELVLSILMVLLAAFAVGGVARFAVPGPDPMPVWATIAIGGVGAFLGFALLGAAGALLGGGEEAAAQPAPGTEEEVAAAAVLTAFVVAVLGATILLILYRKLIQKRPLTGPEAQRMPLRPRGLRRIVTRRPHRFHEETAKPGDSPAEQLEKLVLLRDAGKISLDEFEARKAALVDAI